MKAITELKQGLSEGWKSLTQGWQRFRRERLPEVDALPLPANWGLIAGEVFEDDDRVVVRLEAPGMEVEDFDLHVYGRVLTVRGEKRSMRESKDGRYSMLECAYGSFERAVELPADVDVDTAKARYRRGVLRVELPKVRSAAPRHRRVEVH